MANLQGMPGRSLQGLYKSLQAFGYEQEFTSSPRHIWIYDDVIYVNSLPAGTSLTDHLISKYNLSGTKIDEFTYSLQNPRSAPGGFGRFCVLDGYIHQIGERATQVASLNIPDHTCEAYDTDGAFVRAINYPENNRIFKIETCGTESRALLYDESISPPPKNTIVSVSSDATSSSALTSYVAASGSNRRLKQSFCFDCSKYYFLEHRIISLSGSLSLSTLLSRFDIVGNDSSAEELSVPIKTPLPTEVTLNNGSPMTCSDDYVFLKTYYLPGNTNRDNVFVYDKSTLSLVTSFGDTAGDAFINNLQDMKFYDGLLYVLDSGDKSVKVYDGSVFDFKFDL